jgi:hypothetical protein
LGHSLTWVFEYHSSAFLLFGHSPPCAKNKLHVCSHSGLPSTNMYNFVFWGTTTFLMQVDMRKRNFTSLYPSSIFGTPYLFALTLILTCLVGNCSRDQTVTTDLKFGRKTLRYCCRKCVRETMNYFLAIWRSQGLGTKLL